MARQGSPSRISWRLLGKTPACSERSVDWTPKRNPELVQCKFITQYRYADADQVPSERSTSFNPRRVLICYSRKWMDCYSVQYSLALEKCFNLFDIDYSGKSKRVVASSIEYDFCWYKEMTKRVNWNTKMTRYDNISSFCQKLSANKVEKNIFLCNPVHIALAITEQLIHDSYLMIMVNKANISNSQKDLAESLWLNELASKISENSKTFTKSLYV